MRHIDPNGPLADIAFQVLKVREENYSMKDLLEKILEIVSGAGLPNSLAEMEEIFINTGEVQRLLEKSAPTILSLVESGLLMRKENPKSRNNCFGLREVLWLKSVKIPHNDPYKWNQVLKRRKDELGY